MLLIRTFVYSKSEYTLKSVSMLSYPAGRQFTRLFLTDSFDRHGTFSSSFGTNVDPFQFSKTAISHVVKTTLRLLYVGR